MRTEMRRAEGFRETPSPREEVHLFLRAKPKSHATRHGLPNTPHPHPSSCTPPGHLAETGQETIGAEGTNDPPERHHACSQQMQREAFSVPTLSD